MSDQFGTPGAGRSSLASDTCNPCLLLGAIILIAVHSRVRHNGSSFMPIAV
jgi:hypothetical protein